MSPKCSDQATSGLLSAAAGDTSGQPRHGPQTEQGNKFFRVRPACQAFFSLGGTRAPFQEKPEVIVID